jgi:ATP-dependent RNA helicase DeaD
MDKFRKLGISEPILRVIEEEMFDKPSEIQEKSIPFVLSGKNVIAGSATGSGKTLAFGTGIIQNCKRGNGLQALVMTPTRELAQQVSDALKKFSKYQPLNIISIYGGISIAPQINRLRSADVVVGTPGRIIDHMQRGTMRLNGIKILVLDEADRMFDMGFLDDVEKIIHACPREKQMMLFSATITYDVDRLWKRYMRDAVKVSAEVYVDPTKMTQVYYDIMDNMKFSLLVHLLKGEHSGLVMVFCNTRRNVDFVANNLEMNGLEVIAIHGGFSQDKRSKVIDQFHSKDVHVLVCTDVAARGLDIKGVSHIYNYDLPDDSKEYIHRIGRTARAGEEGKIVNLLCHRDWDNYKRVLRDNPDLDIIKEETPHIKNAKIGWRESPRNFNRTRNSYQRSPRRPTRTYNRSGRR